MKKVCIYFFVFIFLICGCSANDNNTEKQDPDEVIEISYAKNTNGIYRQIELDSGLYRVDYFDFASQKTQPLCTKANCLHEDETCSAIALTTYNGGSLSGIGANDRAIYYIYTIEVAMENKDTGIKDYSPALFLAKSDLDGTNLSVVYQSEQDRVYSGYAYIYKNHLFYPFCGMKYINEEKTIAVTDSAHQFSCVDLETSEETVFSNKEKQDLGYASIYGFIDNTVYYCEYSPGTRIGIDPVTVKSFDFESKETKIDYEQCLITNSRIRENKIFGYDGKRCKYISMDLESGEITDLADGPQLNYDDDTVNIYSSDGIIAISTYDSETPGRYYVYDAEAGVELDEDYAFARKVGDYYLIYGKNGYELIEQA